MLGSAMAKAGSDTVLLVLSDHGFASFTRSFNLNTWLLENGYLALRSDASPETEFPRNIDWSHTRLYALGLNALYVNLRGREFRGIVNAGSEEEQLIAKVREQLLAARDPVTGEAPVTRLDKASEIYSGPATAKAPDLIVGYNRGYRAGWSTVLGGVSPGVLEDNTEPWGADHCIDARLVPGVLLSNRKIVKNAPSLTDIAPTILAEFGIARPSQMKGNPVIGR
jgi:predicted AlkP superfamily phosphohydrolase/phosphomutase